jgi:glycine cleavage system protein P-like pyridoxal-binding family
MGVQKTFLLEKKASQSKKYFKNYLKIMRKIKSQVKTTKTNRTAKITFALNADLCQQAENMLEAQ